MQEEVALDLWQVGLHMLAHIQQHHQQLLQQQQLA
jgi:hypothetical protein